jgi:hypothetical protein
MKKLSTLALLIFGLFFFGCQKENTITGPSAPYSNTVQPVSSNSLQWLEMPKMISHSLQKTISSTGSILGSKGGEVKVNLQYKDGPFGKFQMQASLKIPKHAFTDDQTLNIIVTLDDQTTTATFDPHPMTFNVPLVFDLEYTGIDVSSIDPTTLSFAYLADDGSIQLAKFDKIEVNIKGNKISVSGALIDHFSRFGFVR